MQGDELQDPAFTYCIEKIDNFDKVCIKIAQTNSLIVNYLCIVWLSIGLILYCRFSIHF